MYASLLSYYPMANTNGLKKLVFIGLYFASALCYAQNAKETLSLPEVLSVAKRPGNAEVGKKFQSIDSTTISGFQGKHLGELIASESAISLKTYGVNGIVGAAMRGTSVDHTAVMWNGINLQSPTHGQFDFSLMPIFFVDQVSIEPGSGSGSYGSGAVGGSIVLNNNNAFNRGFQAKAYLSGGSFGNRQVGVGAGYSNTWFSSDTRVFYREAANNYEIRKFYSADYNKYFLLKQPIEQKHCSFGQKGLLQQLNFKLGHNAEISNLTLFTNTDRLLINSFGEQLDESVKNVTSYLYKKDRLDFSATAGIQKELIAYNDTVSSITSRSNSLSGWLQTGAKYYLKGSQQVYAYINPQLITAEVDGYGNAKPSQRRMSVWGGWTKKWLEGKLTSDLSVKQQWINNNSLPIIPSAGINYIVNRHVVVKAHSSSVYHAPDFNDLYWVAGGNPNLLPEEGWSNEAGFEYLSKYIKAELTGFQTRVKNLIVWLPGNPYWSPINVREVRSVGAEFNIKSNFRISAVSVLFDLSYTHTESITTKSLKAEDQTLGKQQLYIPIDNGSARVNLLYKSWSFNVHAHYTGKRFITTSNSGWLPAYTLLDSRLSRSLRFGRSKADLFFAANNINGIFYMTIPGYAMPGRNYEAGITLHINK